LTCGSVAGAMWGRGAFSLLVSWSVLYLLVCRFLQLVVLSGCGEGAKEIEIVALRHQVAVLRRQVDRPDLSDGERVLLADCRGYCLGHRGRVSS
jgi:hypothetical protein